MRREFRYIVIEQRNNEIFESHPVYRVFNKKSGSQLAILSYYNPWRQYVFSSKEGCVFNDSCLRDVLSFLKEIKDTRP